MQPVKPLNVFWRTLNALLYPIMKIISVLSGFGGSMVQETHAWTQQEADPVDLDLSITAVKEHDPQPHKDVSGWLFQLQQHLPGKRQRANFVVVKPTDFSDKWYVGWYAPRHNMCQVQRKALHAGEAVRLLVDVPGDLVFFFGVRQDGTQIKVEFVRHDGVYIWDMRAQHQFKRTRLF